MHTASIAYHNGELKACEQDDVWTVRLANLEARASYLDLALAELLENTPEAHRAAARLLAEVVEQEQAPYSYVAPVPPRERRRAPRHKKRARGQGVWAEPVRLVVRVFVFAVVASTAFMLTTWLSMLR